MLDGVTWEVGSNDAVSILNQSIKKKNMNRGFNFPYRLSVLTMLYPSCWTTPKVEIFNLPFLAFHLCKPTMRTKKLSNYIKFMFSQLCLRIIRTQLQNNFIQNIHLIVDTLVVFFCLPEQSCRNNSVSKLLKHLQQIYKAR